MSDNLREQIYNNLIIKDTEDLLEIWQSGNTAEWNEEVFEIVKEILLERLGYVPPQSPKTQVLQILSNVEEHLDNNELEKALSECERAIQITPDFAIAYNYRGEIYDAMGQLKNAIVNYQRVIQLDPELKDAWENMLSLEAEIEEEFEGSAAKRHLDQALEYAYSGEPEKALEECETAKSIMPSIAIAYNYLGMIFETLSQLESAIDSYLKAIQLNPRFYAARENLANARVRWEEEQYLQVSNLTPDEIQEVSEPNTEFDESLNSEIVEDENPIPGWLYLDSKAFLLIGWAGHRNRPGRSGYDPLETDFELAHMQGVVIRLLITRRFRTRNPIYLLLMTYMGLVYSLPLLGVTELFQGNLNLLPLMIVYSPYWIVGIALLVNVVLSLRLERYSEYSDNGYAFF
jgi:tetratricopeptide (TPR) repeat protein